MRLESISVLASVIISRSTGRSVVIILGRYLRKRTVLVLVLNLVLLTLSITDRTTTTADEPKS